MGASVEGGASLRETDDSIIVDNQASTLALLSNIVVKSGEPITIKTSENPNMPGESEEARVFIVKDYDSIITTNQLENSVSVGNGKVIKVQNKTSYKIDTSGMEAALDSIEPNYTIVVVDNAGNVSPAYYVNIMLKTDELINLAYQVNEILVTIDSTDYTKNQLSSLSKLESYLPTAEKIINSTLETKKESQKNITAAFKNLKSKFVYFLNATGGDVTTVTSDIDIVAPRFEWKYPNVTQATGSSIKLNIQVKEDATAYYVVLPANSQVPDQKIFLNYQGTDDSSIIQRGEITLENGTLKEVPINGLTSQTKYTVYIVLKDNQYNYSTVEWRDFTTE